MKIDKLRLSRYFMLANIIILLSGIIIALVGYFTDKENINLSGLLLNIGSDTIVIGLIAIVGKFLLIDPQDELLEHVKNLEKKAGQKPSQLFVTVGEIEAQEPISQFVGQSHDLLLAGVALRRSVQPHRFLFLDRIKNGAKLRFLLINPESPDVEAIASMWKVAPENIRSSIEDTLHELQFLKNESKKIGAGSVEIRLLDREPSFSFALSNPKNANGVLRAGLRVYNHSAFTRPEWVLKPDDKWFNTFVEICEALWKDAKPHA